MRILVVDDEEIVIESVSQILRQQYPNAEIDSARNSREGLIKLEHFRPQIILTDIKMPGMNGLEFVERIRKVNRVVKIIIVSAYDHFEYAKDAVKYDVEEYVLKPLSKSKLIEVMERTIEKIQEEEVLRNKELDHIEKYYQSIQLVESNFLNSILLGRNYMKYVKHYREILNMKMSNGYFAVVEFVTYTSKTDVESLNVFNQKMSLCSEYMKTEVKYQFDALVSSPFLNRIVIYVESNERENNNHYFNALVSQVYDKFGLKIRIGIGSTQEIERITDSYTEALLSIKLSSADVVRSTQIKTESVSLKEYNDALAALIDGFASKSKDFINSLSTLESQYLRLTQNQSYVEYAESTLIECMVKIHGIYSNRIKNTNASEIPSHYLIDMIKQTTTNKLNEFEKTVKEWYAVQSKMTNASLNAITLAVVEQIRANFRDEISLDEMAKFVNVSPPYLSKLFKDDTGYTFKDYVTELRIEEAKKLLRTTELSLKDICFQIGYNDTNYFIRAFKKYEGLTPKDYQRLNK